MWQIISGYLSLFVMMLGVFIFGKFILTNELKKERKDVFYLILLFSVPQTIIYLTLNGTLKTICASIINIIFYKTIYIISYRKALFLTLLHIIILIIPEVLGLLFLTNVLRLSRNFCYNVYAGSLISNIVIFIMFIPIVFLLKKVLQKIMNEKIENNTKIIIFSILIFVCTVMFFYTFIKEFRFNNNVLIYLITMLVLLFVLFSLIKQTIENNKLTKEYDQLLEFMTTYEEEIEKQRILRHETKNEFLTIRAKLEDKEAEKEILNYIDEILKDKIVVKQEEYAKFGHLPPNGIKGLCYFKMQEAEKKGINVALSISKRIKKSTIFNLETKKQREFAKILGVFLDNAIEASYESMEKKIGIEAHITNITEFKMIISNTFNNKIDSEKIGKERFSTKGKNRGHGLLLVDHIMKNNNRFEIKTEIQGNIYSQIIIVKDLNKNIEINK